MFREWAHRRRVRPRGYGGVCPSNAGTEAQVGRLHNYLGVVASLLEPAPVHVPAHAAIRGFAAGVRAGHSIEAMALVYAATTLICFVIALRFVNPTQIVARAKQAT